MAPHEQPVPGLTSRSAASMRPGLGSLPILLTLSKELLAHNIPQARDKSMERKCLAGWDKASILGHPEERT